MLPVGASPPNPQELLSSGEFIALTLRLEKRFDAVVYDCAAGMEFADSDIVAAHVRTAIVVVRRNRTRFNELRTLVERLKVVNCTIIGTVLNLY